MEVIYSMIDVCEHYSQLWSGMYFWSRGHCLAPHNNLPQLEKAGTSSWKKHNLDWGKKHNLTYPCNLSVFSIFLEYLFTLSIFSPAPLIFYASKWLFVRLLVPFQVLHNPFSFLSDFGGNKWYTRREWSIRDENSYWGNLDKMAILNPFVRSWILSLL